jgi:hypothetical protein
VLLLLYISSIDSLLWFFLSKLLLNFSTQNHLFFSHLRVFGCLAYATNIPASHKFNHRSIPSLFISYPIGQKAYKLFDLSTKKIFTSHDVRFHKNISPSAFVKPNYVLSPPNTNSGPIPLVAHDTFFFISLHTIIIQPHCCLLPSIHNPRLPLSPLSEPTSLYPLAILRTYKRRPKTIA